MILNQRTLDTVYPRGANCGGEMYRGPPGEGTFYRIHRLAVRSATMGVNIDMQERIFEAIGGSSVPIEFRARSAGQKFFTAPTSDRNTTLQTLLPFGRFGGETTEIYHAMAQR